MEENLEPDKELMNELEELREEALEHAVNDFIRQHKGAQLQVEFYGGPYHGEKKLLRRPFEAITNVAGPPKEKPPGSGIFVPEWDYFTYHFKLSGGKMYYVEESKLEEFGD